MNFYSLYIVVVFVSSVWAVYVPENGGQWKTLKPEFQAKGYKSIPIKFGMVVNPVDGKLVEGLNTYQAEHGQIRNSVDSENSNFKLVHNDSPIKAVSCIQNSTLQMSLNDGILRDSNNRIGTIVSSRQLQFDGPTPQFGAVYAAGWVVNKNGQLVLGNQSVFYQCASGDFYNLYDQPIAYQCNPVTLNVVGLIQC